MQRMQTKLLVGAHTSAAGGVQNALLEGKEIGATTIQLFTANQRQWAAKPITPDTAVIFRNTLQETGLEKITSHASYLINLGAPDKENLLKSRSAFQLEIERCLTLGISFLNFHPGAALKSPVEQCLERIVASMLLYTSQLQTGGLTLLLEATAGQGSCVGAKFEELAWIIERVKDQVPVGVCIDTCHIFAAGYDLRTRESLDATLDQFDSVVGLEYVKALHLNDSMKGLGSRVDRHSNLGAGMIGYDAFRYIIESPRLKHLPMYLETPGGPEQWKKEIAMLKSYFS